MNIKQRTQHGVFDAIRLFLEDHTNLVRNTLQGYTSLVYKYCISPTPPICKPHNDPIVLIQQFYVAKDHKRHNENI